MGNIIFRKTEKLSNYSIVMIGKIFFWCTRISGIIIISWKFLIYLPVFMSAFLNDVHCNPCFFHKFISFEDFFFYCQLSQLRTGRRKENDSLLRNRVTIFSEIIQSQHQYLLQSCSTSGWDKTYVAHYAIIADLHEVLPELLKKIQECLVLLNPFFSFSHLQ